MTDQGQADALIWFITISGFGIVLLCLAWIAENIDRFARYLEWLSVTKELEADRSAKEIKEMEKS